MRFEPLYLELTKAYSSLQARDELKELLAHVYQDPDPALQHLVTVCNIVPPIKRDQFNEVARIAKEILDLQLIQPFAHGHAVTYV